MKKKLLLVLSLLGAIYATPIRAVENNWCLIHTLDYETCMLCCSADYIAIGGQLLPAAPRIICQQACTQRLVG